MDDGQWFADQFTEHRPRLRAVAYRMLGSVTDADDALQEAWIRSTTADGSTISNVEAWLSTVVGRVCIDMLRARASRPEVPAGTWLPEPIVAIDGDHNPEDAALLADSVGLALLVVLDRMAPPERLAFVLHDMFGVPFDEIAPIVDRTPAATRQLASRARRRVQGTPTKPDPDLNTQRRVVDAFLTAARAGDFEGLITVLDPDVVFRVDAGTRAGVTRVLAGAEDVAGQLAANGFRYANLCQPALVNGAAGIVARTPTAVVAVVGMTVVNERIAAIDLILDQSKLSGLAVQP
jgi:RNA polymerase sigma factor (sigma-70 family)